MMTRPTVVDYASNSTMQAEPQNEYRRLRSDFWFPIMRPKDAPNQATNGAAAKGQHVKLS